VNRWSDAIDQKLETMGGLIEERSALQAVLAEQQKAIDEITGRIDDLEKECETITLEHSKEIEGKILRLPHGVVRMALQKFVVEWPRVKGRSDSEVLLERLQAASKKSPDLKKYLLTEIVQKVDKTSLKRDELALKTLKIKVRRDVLTASCTPSTADYVDGKKVRKII